MPHRSASELEQERLEIVAAQHDRSAFGPIYERYVDQIYAYVLMLTRDTHRAEDVTAATFAKAIEEIPRFEWRGVPYSAWLYRVAGNLVSHNRRRREWIQLPANMVADATDPADLVVEEERGAEVRSAVASLPDDQRRAVMLRFGGGLRNAEIAEIMQRSEGAVKLLTFRALTTLRGRFGAPLPADRREGRAG